MQGWSSVAGQRFACHAICVDVVIGRELDLDDLYNTPDDGNRYEILDSALVMTPAPSRSHQRALLRLAVLLHEPARAKGFEVFPAPFAWRIGPGQVPEPDVIVAAPEATSERAVEGPPVLVIEILSPTGQARDLDAKRRVYAEGGANFYWIVDPAVPSLTVLRLVGEVYQEVAHVEGSNAYESGEPFAVRVVPRELTR